MKQVHAWHQTKLGLLTFLLVEVVLLYIVASLAIARGNLWYYLFTAICLVGIIQNIVRMIEKVVRLDV